jgi:hypothetical protein
MFKLTLCLVATEVNKGKIKCFISCMFGSGKLENKRELYILSFICLVCKVKGNGRKIYVFVFLCSMK